MERDINMGLLVFVLIQMMDGYRLCSYKCSYDINMGLLVFVLIQLMDGYRLCSYKWSWWRFGVVVIVCHSKSICCVSSSSSFVEVVLLLTLLFFLFPSLLRHSFGLLDIHPRCEPHGSSAIQWGCSWQLACCVMRWECHLIMTWVKYWFRCIRRSFSAFIAGRNRYND